jgi:hypothetical protein
MYTEFLCDGYASGDDTHKAIFKDIIKDYMVDGYSILNTGSVRKEYVENLAGKYGFEDTKLIEAIIDNEVIHAVGKSVESNVFNPILPVDPNGYLDFLSMVVSSIPGIGDVYDATGVILGKDLITGEKISLLERGVLTVAVLVPIIGGKMLSQPVKTTIKGSNEILDSTGHIIKNFNKAEDIAKNAIKNSDEIAAGIKGVENAGDNIIDSTDEIINGGSKSVDDIIEGGSEAVNVDLKYKDGWSVAQKAEADAKLKALTEANTVKTPATRSGTSASSRYKSSYGNDSVPRGYDVDHTIDLQLGGVDDILNMNPLDMSVNRSLGVQIKNAIKDYEVGTVFDKFTIK